LTGHELRERGGDVCVESLQNFTCRATAHLACSCIFSAALCCLCPLFCLSYLALLLLLLLLALLRVPPLLALQLRELLLLPWQCRTRLSQVTPAIMKRLPRFTVQITLPLTEPILHRQACHEDDTPCTLKLAELFVKQYAFHGLQRLPYLPAAGMLRILRLQ